MNKNNKPFPGYCITYRWSTAIIALLLIGWLNLGYAAERQFTIGLYAPSNLRNATQLQETVHYLNTKLPKYQFRLVTYTTLQQLEQALATKQIDFIITDPNNYVKLEADYHIARIATLVDNFLGQPVAQQGVVFIAYSGNTGILKPEDMKGKTFGTHDVMRSSLWWLQVDALRQYGIEPVRDFKSIRTYDSAKSIVLSVISGKIEVGAIKAGILERLEKNEIIKRDSIRVLATKHNTQLPFRSSTITLPEWPISKAQHTPVQVAEQVAISLIQLKPTDAASSNGQYYGWTVPLNYQRAHELARRLKIAPYADFEHVTLTQVATQYWYWIVLTLLVILVLAFMFLRMRYLNRMLVRTERELKEYNSILQEIASRDSLTKLANRRKLDESLTQEWWRACREQKPISAILIDIDHFKEYNDFNGHLAGDAYLVKVAEYIENTFKRSADIKARYGGDEFVIVLPDTSRTECQRLAESLKTAIDRYVAGLKVNPASPLSMSLGIATLVPEQNSVPESLIAAADAALYQSKNQGRNQIYSAEGNETIN